MAGSQIDYTRKALTLADIHYDIKIKTLVEAGSLEVDENCRIIPSSEFLEQAKQENPDLPGSEQLRVARARTFLGALEAYFRLQHENWTS